MYIFSRVFAKLSWKNCWCNSWGNSLLWNSWWISEKLLVCTRGYRWLCDQKSHDKRKFINNKDFLPSIPCQEMIQKQGFPPQTNPIFLIPFRKKCYNITKTSSRNSFHDSNRSHFFNTLLKINASIQF